MELGLNLFWLVLAVTSLVFWLRQRSHRTAFGRSKRSLRGLITLGCALAVLFPIISLTDDLHGEQVAVEDSSSRTLKKWTGSETSSDLTRLSNIPARIAFPFSVSSCTRCTGQAGLTDRSPYRRGSPDDLAPVLRFRWSVVIANPPNQEHGWRPNLSPAKQVH
jgi:hypothetical protein